MPKDKSLIMNFIFPAKGWDLKQAIQDYLKEGKENSSRPVLTKSDAFDENSCKF